MTDQPAPRPTTSLTGEEFKALAMTNVGQLQHWLQNTPTHIESGAAGLTPEAIALVEFHMNRCLMFLRSWSLTKIEGMQQSAMAEATTTASETNGATRKGGWPKGKKRTPRAPATEAGQ